MPVDNLTEEQKQVVYHPPGKHARVLAVAGSGKTTTMVHRIEHLVREKKVDPESIRVLMFNKLARKQFKEKLMEIGIPLHDQPQVHTFHSFSYQFINNMMARGLLPGIINFWIGDKAELTRRYVHRAINNLKKNQPALVDSEDASDLWKGSLIPPKPVDPDGVIEAIGLWKGSLIPPLKSRAGYRGNEFFPLVYEEFERLRIEENALTYDDFIPMAVGILETEQDVNEQWSSRVNFVIADEYQDVNYGQQRLIELLAGQHADVMVVGDDDQTIYEWRGARPSYILSEFQTVFNNKPFIDYKLSRSFRFGPVIAQCAENVISINRNRFSKPLIAHSSGRRANIHIVSDSSEQSTDVNKELAQQVVALVVESKDPRKVIVLGRMFSQLSGLEAEFLTRKIPYRIIGRAPFFERREIQVLLDYVRLAERLNEPITKKSESLLLSVANTPNRKLQKRLLSHVMSAAYARGESTRDALKHLAEDDDTPLTRAQREKVDDLLARLERLGERLNESTLLAGDFLEWLVKSLAYLEHFDNYYGMGESSEDRKRTVAEFCGYALLTRLTMLNFVSHVDKLDPTRGVPEEQQIVMTTVFRTKGLEYDHVIIPRCEEGYMPCKFGGAILIYDKAHIVQEPIPSEIIDNERRLFYVAITRARKSVLIGTSQPPRKGSQRNSSPSRPSQFLYEMELEPTIAIMDCLQRFISGITEAKNELLERVVKFGGNKKITNNLVSEYLSDAKHGAFAREIEIIAEKIPATSFTYPTRFASETIVTAPALPEDIPWWEEEER